MPKKPIFFASSYAFRTWLEEHHDQAQELWVGFHKMTSGKPSLTWPESVDVAFCFGWIDGIRKSVNAESYTIRFTPRKPRSTWSAVNIKRARELRKIGLMQPPGLKAFEKRQDDKSAIYSYEQRKTAKLSGVYEKQFRARKKAWEFFQTQPPWYRRTASFWVISAKKEETRLRRLATLIEDSECGRLVAPLRRPTRSK